MIDILEAKRRLESIGELPREHRRAALETLSNEVNELVLAVGCTACATTDVIRGVKSVAEDVHAALVRARKK